MKISNRVNSTFDELLDHWESICSEPTFEQDPKIGYFVRGVLGPRLTDAGIVWMHIETEHIAAAYIPFKEFLFVARNSTRPYEFWWFIKEDDGVYLHGAYTADVIIELLRRLMSHSPRTESEAEYIASEVIQPALDSLMRSRKIAMQLLETNNVRLEVIIISPGNAITVALNFIEGEEHA